MAVFTLARLRVYTVRSGRLRPAARFTPTIRRSRCSTLADAFAGFKRLYVDGTTLEEGCWAYARRRFHDRYIKKRTSVNPEALARIAKHPVNRIDELLPWAVADQLQA